MKSRLVVPFTLTLDGEPNQSVGQVKPRLHRQGQLRLLLHVTLHLITKLKHLTLYLNNGAFS